GHGVARGGIRTGAAEEIGNVKDDKRQADEDQAPLEPVLVPAHPVEHRHRSTWKLRELLMVYHELTVWQAVTGSARGDVWYSRSTRCHQAIEQPAYGGTRRRLTRIPWPRSAPRPHQEPDRRSAGQAKSLWHVRDPISPLGFVCCNARFAVGWSGPVLFSTSCARSTPLLSR